MTGRRPKIWGFRILVIYTNDLRTYHIGAFYFPEFTTLHAYDLCTFYIHQYKLNCIKEIF